MLAAVLIGVRKRASAVRSETVLNAAAADAAITQSLARFRVWVRVPVTSADCD
jgi:hypothetical protein